MARKCVSCLMPGAPVAQLDKVHRTRLPHTGRLQPRPVGRDGFGVVGAEGDTDLVLWRELPEDLNERAVAVRALRLASRERPDLLRGILYWKLSSLDEHRAIEPFVAILGSGDPLLSELRGFREPVPETAVE